jgi:hypothetical protein
VAGDLLDLGEHVGELIRGGYRLTLTPSGKGVFAVEQISSLLFERARHLFVAELSKGMAEPG